MFNKCQVKSSCLEEGNETRTSINKENEKLYEETLTKEKGDLTKIIEGEPDLSKAVEISQRTEREYVAITAYQPVDVVTRTVEVPFVRTIETTIPKITYENKIKEIPKYYSKIVEKVVEVPEIKYVDKIVDVPHIQYYFKYIPKVEVKENIIKKPVYEKKIVEKIVEVPKIKEVQRYQEVETVEYIVKYIPKDKSEYKEKVNEDQQQTKDVNENNLYEESSDVVNSENETKEKKGEYKEESTQNIASGDLNTPTDNINGTRLIKSAPIDMNQGEFLQQNAIYNKYVPSISTPGMNSNIFTKSMQDYRQTKSGAFPSFGLQNELSMMQLKKSSSILPAPSIEQVFRPKIVKNIEVQKHVPISVDVPVPYMVPKPVVVNIEIPVLKFRDTFVPIPVRRKIIPKIRWISDIYQVVCIKEKPYLKIQDVIKPIPCDVDIKYRECMEKACAINPNELPQDDVHAMWMKVNAHLADKKKKEYGNLYPYYRTNNENKKGISSQMEYNRNEEREYSKEEYINFREENENSITIKENRENEENNILQENKEKGESDENIKNEERGEKEEEEEDENEENKEKNEIEENEEKHNQETEEGNSNMKSDSEKNIIKNKSDVHNEDANNENKNIQKDEITNKEYKKKRENNESNNADENIFESSETFMNEMKKEYFEEHSVGSLHPSHPLAMAYLQNKWIETDTLRTHELYTNDFIKANIYANFNTRNGNIKMSPFMRDKEFLKTASPLMSAFKQNNISNIESYYNNAIFQNINEEASKYKNHQFNEMEEKNEATEVKLYHKINNVKKEDRDSTNNKCCNYFCKK
ncbi:inner membrane complex protein 1a, putative [Plasmodium gallinaceum]|uniref:Inner membrane complex protein 1a, putative n=1 Tax=Plasmodium gallinaceum TaxID=5849 RepID=A0A1J1GS59_PLAGA|nr:inner membrane complex protein 1a, putative [Plasmodium gallinaceum]CRG95268.1 inner membrane complex protein 1a, putative [Plasmodium gallinaceum]